MLGRASVGVLPNSPGPAGAEAPNNAAQRQSSDDGRRVGDELLDRACRLIHVQFGQLGWPPRRVIANAAHVESGAQEDLPSLTQERKAHDVPGHPQGNLQRNAGGDGYGVLNSHQEPGQRMAQHEHGQEYDRLTENLHDFGYKTILDPPAHFLQVLERGICRLGDHRQIVHPQRLSSEIHR